jgi:spore photoproduct lyase
MESTRNSEGNERPDSVKNARACLSPLGPSFGGRTFRDKFEQSKERTLFGFLAPATQKVVREICYRYPFTFQEIRQIAEIARDLEMWGIDSLENLWDTLEAQTPQDVSLTERKKYLFRALSERILQLKRLPKDYSCGMPVLNLRSKKPKAVTRETPDRIFGDCPVASPKTVCCNLRTIDAVQNCAYGCSYCTIQTFYGSEIRFDANVREKLAAIHLDPKRFYHFGTGQSSDSLAWGNHKGMLDALCEFAAAHSNILLEFKTKSSNVAYFLDHKIPSNVVCSWSLNPEIIIRNEEHGTASLAERLRAARVVADRGVRVAFHFHPIIYYLGWDRDYPQIAEELQQRFRPEEVLFVSFGSVTLIKPVVRKIRERGGPSRILQMEMVPDPHGKWTYPAPVKLELFRTLVTAFQPWKDSVYMYFCMEHAWFWDQVFGHHYSSNDAFEDDFGNKIRPKIQASLFC